MKTGRMKLKDRGDVEEQAHEASNHLGREDTLVDVPEPLIVVEDEGRGRKVVNP